jgi:ERF superfamily
MNEILELERTTAPATQPSKEVAGPLGMAMRAMQAGMSVADMRGMLELQKDWEANEARKAYVAAMSEFKKNPPEIFKRKEVAFGDTRYSHATIGDVTSLTVEGLAKHGFSHRWDTKQADGRIVVSCILTHNLGHSESTMLEASPDSSGKKNAIQQVASTVTYLQRYTLLAACGLATKDMEDDDGRCSEGINHYDADGNLQHWIDKANAAINLIALSETRKMAGHDFNAAKDVGGWNKFKAFVDAKRTSLEGS